MCIAERSTEMQGICVLLMPCIIGTTDLNQTKTHQCLLVSVYERAGKNLGAYSQCLCGSGHVGLSGDALN